MKTSGKFSEAVVCRCCMKNCSEEFQITYRKLPVPESTIHKISKFIGQNIILAILLDSAFVEKDSLLSYTIFDKFALIAELGKNGEVQ